MKITSHHHDDDHDLYHDDNHGGDVENDMHLHTLDPSLWISMKSSFKEKCTTFSNHYFKNLNFYSNLILI